MPIYDAVYLGREVTCTRCGTTGIDLIEIPEPWIDGDRYVCGDHLIPVAAQAAIGLTDPEPPAPPDPPRDLRAVT